MKTAIECRKCGTRREVRHRRTTGQTYLWCPYCAALRQRVQEYRKLPDADLAEQRKLVERSQEIGLKAVEQVMNERRNCGN